MANSKQSQPFSFPPFVCHMPSSSMQSRGSWSQAVGSLVSIGGELLARGQHDEAIAIFDAAHSVITTPSASQTWVDAATSFQVASQLLGSSAQPEPDYPNEISKHNTTDSPDLYQEDECDVGPRMLKTPVSASDLAQSPTDNCCVLLEAIVLFNKGLIYHAKGSVSEAKQIYEVVTFTVQNLLSCMIGAPSRVYAELAMRSHNNLGFLNYLEGSEGIAAACFETATQFARHLSPFKKTYRLEYATVLSNWCRVHWMNGDISDKLHQGLQEVLHIRSCILSWDHPDVAAARYNVAVADYARQDSQKAARQLLQYLQIASHRSKVEHLNDLDAIPALIFLLLIQNEDKEDHSSQELVRGLRALQDKRQDFGPNSLEVASVLNFVGTLLFHKEEFESALVFFQEELRLENDSKSLCLELSPCTSAETTSVSVTCNNIGRILQELNRYDEAIAYYRRALESENYDASDVILATEKQGNCPASVAARAANYKSSSANLYSTVWYNLGLIYDKLGSYNEAITAFEMSLELRKVLLGNNHPDIACLLYNIGVLQMEQQRLDGASNSFREALRIRRVGTVGQLSDLHVVKTLEKLASLQKAKGNIEGAIDASREILSIQEASLEYCPITRFKKMGETLRAIAELHHLSGDMVAAVSMALDSVNKLRVASQCSGEKFKANTNHEIDRALVLDRISSTEQLVTSLLLLGSLHHEMSEPLQAQDILQRAVTVVEQVAVSTTSTHIIPASLQSLLEVTRMLSICHCAPQA